MPQLIGVVNTSPMYTLGLRGALSSRGFAFEVVNDPSTWLVDHDAGALLVGVHSASDIEIVIDLSRMGSAPVVSVVSHGEVSLIKQSLEAGAKGAVSEQATSEEMTIALEAALLDRTILPATLARELCRRAGEQILPLSDLEVSMLRGLAEGATIANLGERYGYSEREMYRRLRDIYKALGVERRVEALVKLARAGFID